MLNSDNYQFLSFGKLREYNNRLIGLIKKLIFLDSGPCHSLINRAEAFDHQLDIIPCLERSVNDNLITCQEDQISMILKDYVLEFYIAPGRV